VRLWRLPSAPATGPVIDMAGGILNVLGDRHNAYLPPEDDRDDMTF